MHASLSLFVTHTLHRLQRWIPHSVMLCLSLVCLCVLIGCDSKTTHTQSDTSVPSSTQAKLVYTTNKNIRHVAQQTQGKQAQLYPELFAPQKNTLIVYMPENALHLKRVLDDFSKEKQIDVSVFSVGKSDAELLHALKNEGKASPADVVIFSTGYALQLAKKAGVFQAVASERLEKSLQKKLQGNKRWFGLASNLTVIASTKKLPALTGYEDLLSPRWRNKLCMKNANAPSTKAILTNLLQKKNVSVQDDISKNHDAKRYEKATRILEKWQKNLAQTNMTHDEALLDAVASGKCALAVVNERNFHSYNALKKTPVLKKTTFTKVGHNQVNLIGAGVSKYAPNPLKALLLIEWLAMEDSQVVLSADSNTQPVITTLLSASAIQALKNKARSELAQSSVENKQRKKTKKRRSKPKKKTNKKKNNKITQSERITEQKVIDPLLEKYGVTEVSELDTEQAKAYGKAKRKEKALEKLAKQPIKNTAMYLSFQNEKDITWLEELIKQAKL